MSAEATQLAQARYNDTTSHAFISVNASGRPVQISRLLICNTTASPATFQLCHDIDGTTYDETTALYWNSPVPGNSTVTISADSEDDGFFISPGGNMAVQNGTANALTFTAYGHVRGPR